MGTEKLERQSPFRARRYHVRLLADDGSNRSHTSSGTQPVKVGSADGNDLVVDDPAVSRFHLRLRASGDGVSVDDVGSTNGSWIGGARFRNVDIERDTQITIGNSRLSIELDAVQEVATSPKARLGHLHGRSPAMRSVFKELAFAARSRGLSVLLRGETGTGKELAARTLHDIGPRARAPFVVVDCSALSPTLIESQLFGHVKGAFTDAKTGSAGPFERADGGTVFLDEIGELPLPQQSKLLRVIQEREVVRLGGSRKVKIDVKVIAATRRDLLEEMNAGRFREDLYFRLAGEEVFLPALRERREDIPVLAKAIAEELVEREGELACHQITDDVMQELSRRSWPGNIRELRHSVHRYLIRGELAANRTALRISTAASHLAVDDLLDMSFSVAVREFEQRFLRHALERERGHHQRAAKRVGINRSTLYRILRRESSD